ncbi:purine-cytosine permease family protein [Glaciecola petra]|uniref:Cytosine permease n=1 Tax=Glaciecola petra TaxID=3075602 RepID=A0ABU2ZUM3_9ALTE|nr:cytosine permease [Aestuariibacter sp. P117]MDT0596343.1 cytosine permease [Aestuariibacter sp. P117]
MTEHNEFDANAIPQSKRIAWPRIAAVSAMVSFSLPTFITGLEIGQGLPVSQALWAILIGSIILTLIGGIMGAIGAKTGLSSYLLVRIAFGNKGAGLVNIAFAVSLIGWFGVNLDLFSYAVIKLAEAKFAIQLSAWPIEIGAGILMIVTTIYGFKAINILATLLVPILAVVTALMAYQAGLQLGVTEYLSLEKTSTLSLDDGIAAIVGAIIIGTIILPDITRFAKHWKGGVYTAIWAYLIIELIVFLIAGYASVAMQQPEILDLMLALGIGASAFFIVIGSSWVLNSLNLYSTVLSVEATYKKFKGATLTTVLGAIGVVAAFFNILDFFIDFLVFLAAIFVPVAGIIIMDYLVVNRDRYTAETLNDNVSVSIPAFIAWLLACIPSAFALPFSVTQINVLDAILLASLSYFILAKLPALQYTKKQTPLSNTHSIKDSTK